MAGMTVGELVVILKEEDQSIPVKVSVAEGLAPLHSIETFEDCVILWDGSDWRMWG